MHEGLVRAYYKEAFPDDLQRLQKRLSLREGGLCFIGFALREKEVNKFDLCKLN
ncbi:hypothetical protein BMS3Abin05_00617 [bacterium BMS3Abin05]|nr:hypothetical protein BMS3Abin05_00617 [bacterium BMS3Abin05]GBE27762.1 hypothetical protein BMS3Bbin03_01691 [bacterium BMS3Bbin03]